MTPGTLQLENAIELIRSEYLKARAKHGPLRNSHEGYAVILEELDEAWAEIKCNNAVLAKEELAQVAAMCLAFILEVPHE